MEGIFALLQLDDSEIRNKTMEALREIVEINHKHMGAYLENFYAITKEFLSRAESDLEMKSAALFSIELWMILCESELEPSTKTGMVTSFNWQQVASLFFNGLQQVQSEITVDSLEDEDEQLVALKCADALNFLSQVIGDDMLDLCTQYTSALNAHLEKQGGPCW